MEGKLFLETARFLLRQQLPSEADCRTAVSRAYYACFLETRRVVFHNCSQQHLRAHQLCSEKGIRHDKLSQSLKGCDNDDVKSLGEGLADLRGRREDADYKMDVSMTVDDAKGAIEAADQLLGELFGVPAREIGSAVDGYLRKIGPR